MIVADGALPVRHAALVLNGEVEDVQVEFHGVAFRSGDWLTVLRAAEPPLTRH